MKNIVFAFLVATIFKLSAASENVVEGVSCRNLSDGRVEISYTLNQAPVIVTLSARINDEPVNGINFRQVTGDVNKKIAETGAKKIYWRPGDDTAKADGSSTHIMTANAFLKDATVRVVAWQIDDPPDVMVVDLSEPFYGENRIRYYENVQSLPGGLLDNLAYRFQKLVMKRIHAKDVPWLSGCSYCGTTTTTDAKYDPETCYTGGQEYPVSRQLDHDYYLGVFELTKGQHSMIAGMLKEGKYNLRGSRLFRPADSLSFRDIRGGEIDESGKPKYFYPDPPDPESILGKLRARTGLKFDLPGEYEWEFAANAGHGPTVMTYKYQEVGSTPAFWGNGQRLDVSKGKIRDDGLPGRYACNSGYYDPETLAQSSTWSNSTIYGPDHATAICGDYPPNDFGIYDMHGNVGEWCLDYYTKTSNNQKSAPVNANGLLPLLPKDGTVNGGDITTNRLIRGGSFIQPMKNCRSSYRGQRASSFAAGSTEFGCRLICPVVGREITE